MSFNIIIPIPPSAFNISGVTDDSQKNNIYLRSLSPGYTIPVNFNKEINIHSSEYCLLPIANRPYHKLYDNDYKLIEYCNNINATNFANSGISGNIDNTINNSVISIDLSGFYNSLKQITPRLGEQNRNIHTMIDLNTQSYYYNNRQNDYITQLRNSNNIKKWEVVKPSHVIGATHNLDNVVTDTIHRKLNFVHSNVSDGDTAVTKDTNKSTPYNWVLGNAGIIGQGKEKVSAIHSFNGSTLLTYSIPGPYQFNLFGIKTYDIVSFRRIKGFFLQVTIGSITSLDSSIGTYIREKYIPLFTIRNLSATSGVTQTKEIFVPFQNNESRYYDLFDETKSNIDQIFNIVLNGNLSFTLQSVLYETVPSMAPSTTTTTIDGTLASNTLGYVVNTTNQFSGSGTEIYATNKTLSNNYGIVLPITNLTSAVTHTEIIYKGFDQSNSSLRSYGEVLIDWNNDEFKAFMMSSRNAKLFGGYGYSQIISNNTNYISQLLPGIAEVNPSYKANMYTYKTDTTRSILSLPIFNQKVMDNAAATGIKNCNFIIRHYNDNGRCFSNFRFNKYLFLKYNSGTVGEGQDYNYSSYSKFNPCGTTTDKYCLLYRQNAWGRNESHGVRSYSSYFDLVDSKGKIIDFSKSFYQNKYLKITYYAFSQYGYYTDAELSPISILANNNINDTKSGIYYYPVSNIHNGSALVPEICTAHTHVPLHSNGSDTGPYGMIFIGNALTTGAYGDVDTGSYATYGANYRAVMSFDTTGEYAWASAKYVIAEIKVVTSFNE